MTVTVRFAPAPTGRIHMGNTRTAVMNFLFARQQGGKFLLRIDDTDADRSQAEYVDGILEDLAWLDLHHDGCFKQSERFEAYDAAASKLRDAGLLYPCYETPDELDRKRKFQRARGEPPVYDRAALKLTDAEKKALEAEGRKPHWRFKLDGSTAEWFDLVRGACHIDTASISDPVLIREDGTYLYTLPSVVDDIDYAITHVIRGEDHLTNSGWQRQIFQALGGEAPALAHLSLLIAPEGQQFSKREGSLSVQNLREEGIEPMAINAMLAKLGTSEPVEPRLELAQLIDEFSFDKISLSPATFDKRELYQVNARLMHETPFHMVEERLKDLGVGGGTAFWDVARANIERLADAGEWWKTVSGEIDPVVEDAEFCAKAASLLPDGEPGESTWADWTAAIKDATGAKGKALFMPLRKALTGRDRGPDMADLLPFIGREKAVKRLKGERA